MLIFFPIKMTVYFNDCTWTHGSNFLWRGPNGNRSENLEEVIKMDDVGVEKQHGGGKSNVRVPHNWADQCFMGKKTVEDSRNGQGLPISARPRSHVSPRSYFAREEGLAVTLFKGNEKLIKTDRNVAELGAWTGATGLLVQKNCEHEKWKWDDDCIKTGRPNVTINECVSNYRQSKCREHQIRECKNVDNFDNNANCRWFCTKKENEDECRNKVLKFCEAKAAANQNTTQDNLCVQYVQDTSNLFKNTCNASTMTLPGCQAYCSNSSNIRHCEPWIKGYCVGSNLKTQFCIERLQDSSMHGKHDAEMQKYCNQGEGQNLPLCNCMNIEKTKNHFKSIDDENIIARLSKLPQCYSPDCVPPAYMPANNTCPPITICKNLIGNINITGKENVINLSNNCGNVDSSGNPTDPAGPGGNPPAGPGGDSFFEKLKANKWLFGGGVGGIIIFSMCSAIVCCIVFLMLGKKRR